MFDPFAGHHPPKNHWPLRVVGLKVAYPIRCPYCREKLQARYSKMFGWWRWCRRHQCVVSYDYEGEHVWVAALW